MKKTNGILLVLMGSLFSFGCSTSEPIACYLPAADVSSNSPVLSGQSINLATTFHSESGNAIYDWTGPNGFVSHLQNPILPNATTAMAGEYSLKTTIGICESELSKTTVQVINNTVTCTPTNNTATFINSSPTANFYSFDSYAITDDRYQLSAGDSNWHIQVIFSGDITPISGIYHIVSSTTPVSQSTVQIKTTRTLMNGNSYDYFAKTGDVSVAYVSGKAVVKFCTVPFALPTSTGSDFTCTTQFTQD